MVAETEAAPALVQDAAVVAVPEADAAVVAAINTTLCSPTFLLSVFSLTHRLRRTVCETRCWGV